VTCVTVAAVRERGLRCGPQPAALVWGAADQFHKLRYGVRFAAYLGVTLRGIEGGRHFVPQDHSERSRRRSPRWLRGLESA
jgi:hypothetical protein